MKSQHATHKWRFPSRIRPHAFSWKSSRLAVQRIKEAVTEIASIARHDPVLAAEGGVRLIERLSPALEHVDSSSGALGSAVNGAIEALVLVIAAAPVASPVREKWLDRLYEAHAADEIPYIERLTDHWGELCGTQQLASIWADRPLDITVAKRYPSVPRARILSDLIKGTPGEEGKWFATAKELGMYDVALQLVRASPCDPKTLTRAARDFAEREPRFAYGAGFAALFWLTRGHGYEITSLDVWGAYHSTLKACANQNDYSTRCSVGSPGTDRTYAASNLMKMASADGKWKLKTWSRSLLAAFGVHDPGGDLPIVSRSGRTKEGVH